MIGTRLGAFAIAAALVASHATPVFQFSAWPAKFGNVPGSERTVYVSNTGPDAIRVTVALSEIRRVHGACVNAPGKPGWANVISPRGGSFTVQPGTRRGAVIVLAKAHDAGVSGNRTLAVNFITAMNKGNAAHPKAMLTAQGQVIYPGSTHAAPCLAITPQDAPQGMPGWIVPSLLAVIVCAFVLGTLGGIRRRRKR